MAATLRSNIASPHKTGSSSRVLIYCRTQQKTTQRNPRDRLAPSQDPFMRETAKRVSQTRPTQFQRNSRSIASGPVSVFVPLYSFKLSKASVKFPGQQSRSSSKKVTHLPEASLTSEASLNVKPISPSNLLKNLKTKDIVPVSGQIPLLPLKEPKSHQINKSFGSPHSPNSPKQPQRHVSFFTNDSIDVTPESMNVIQEGFGFQNARLQSRTRKFLQEKIGTKDVNLIPLSSPRFVEDRIIYFCDRYIFKEVIGLGAFGVVILAEDRHAVRTVSPEVEYQERAVKIVCKSRISHTELEILKNETRILQLLHKNSRVVQLYEVHETSEHILLVMERIKGHSLLHFTNPLPILRLPQDRPLSQEEVQLKKKRFLSLMPQYFEREKLKGKRQGSRQELNETECAMIMKGVLEGIEYIHSKNIIHRDIKPQNILLSDQGELSSVKLIDFGLSSFYERSASIHSKGDKCGTLLYMAPEQAEKQRYGKGVDMWSCGVLMYQLLTGNHPFYVPTDTQDSLLQKMKNSVVDFSASDLARDLFSKLCAPTAPGRYNASRALLHPWITRDFSERVPLTLQEQFSRMEQEQTLQKMLKIMFFLSIVQTKSEDVFQIDPAYRKKVEYFSEEGTEQCCLECNQSHISADGEVPTIQAVQQVSAMRGASTASHSPSPERDQQLFSNILSTTATTAVSNYSTVSRGSSLKRKTTRVGTSIPRRLYKTLKGADWKAEDSAAVVNNFFRKDYRATQEESVQAILKTSSEDKFNPGQKSHNRITSRTQSHTDAGSSGNTTAFNPAGFPKSGFQPPPLSRDAGGWLEQIMRSPPYSRETPLLSPKGKFSSYRQAKKRKTMLPRPSQKLSSELTSPGSAGFARENSISYPHRRVNTAYRKVEYVGAREEAKFTGGEEIGLPELRKKSSREQVAQIRRGML